MNENTKEQRVRKCKLVTTCCSKIDEWRSGGVTVGILEDGRPYADLYCYFPQNFFHKSFNEPFIQHIMGVVLERKNWTSGNPDLFEPDYFCDGIPFEFTIASDKKRKNNFIQKYRMGQYSSEDVEKEVFGYVKSAVESKAQKHYSVPNVHLCVLCLIDCTSWVWDEYGSETYDLVDGWREEFFSEIKDRYILGKNFNNIFLIFPDMFARWWVWDVSTNHRSSIELSPSLIMSKRVPFILEQNIFDELIQKYNLT